MWKARERRVWALNASGRAPLAARAELLQARGLATIPSDSAFAVSVPGAVDGWQTLLGAHGSMSLAETLKPAIEYADQGFPVSEIIAFQWARSMGRLLRHPSGAELTLGGSPPVPGDVMRLPHMAGTLRQIAAEGPDAVYRGSLGKKIARFVQEHGGWLSKEDLALHASTWDEPISTNYRGVRVWGCPPNGQGLVALLALNIAEGLDLRGLGFQSAETYHHLIEAARLAFADGLRYIADPRAGAVPTEALLTKGYAAARRKLLHGGTALEAVPFGVPGGDAQDTVYVACVDGEGNACSLISSIFEEFGSGLVVPSTGIVLQNRAALFSLEPGHPNRLEPGKRPYHTIIPALATRDGELWLTFGVMGGFQQPQGHVQVIVNMVDFGLEPQAALDARHFSILPGGWVALEDDIPPGVVRALRDKGHAVTLISGEQRILFGGGQIIERDPATGILRAGSEPRKDGCAIGF